MHKLTLVKLCGSYMADYQKLKILQMLMPKVIKFLKRIYIKIKKPLIITFSSF